MEYVFVGGRPDPVLDYNYSTVCNTGNLLISMIDVLNSSNSSAKSFSFFKSLYQMHQAYRNAEAKFNTFLDSGGYSIIVGDVKANQTREFIERYNTRIVEGKNIYDYVFSLDIPIFLSEPQFNTKDAIKQFNRESLFQTYSLAAKDETLRNKLYFVWHFKIKEQYDIWNELYNELNINGLIRNRAAGGMVGLRGITQIDFSPFIAPMYRCLLDYINGDTSVPFRFHALGVYIQHDRFFLCFLEKLFNWYLFNLENVSKCHITYDSVNYMRTAQLRSRDLDIYNFNGSSIDIYKHTQCPDNVYRNAYGNNYQLALDEIERVKNKQKMKDVGAFTPLNVYSNVQLDKFFAYIINKYEVLERFLNGNLQAVFLTLAGAHPNVFTSRRIECLKMNFRQCWKFHQWWLKQRTYETFHPLMYKFIEDIKFPASLAETVQINNNINLKDHFGDLITDG